MQEAPDFAGEAIRFFDVREMRAVEFEITCASDVVRKKLAVGRSRRRVVLSGDDHIGNPDRVYLFEEVEIAKPGAASGVSFGAGGFKNFLNAGDDRGVSCAEGGGEPALDGRGRDVLHSFLENACDASVPHFSGADFGGSAAENDFVKMLRGICGEPHADLAAHGESAEVKAVELLRVGKSENVFSESLDGIGAGRDGRFAMAAGVGPENAEGFRELGDLRVPHGKVCAERIRKDESKLTRWACERVMDLGVVRIKKGHRTFR